MNNPNAVETAIHLTKAKAHRGNARFWLEGNKPAKFGFGPGTEYYVLKNSGEIVLSLADLGEPHRATLRTVSSCQRNGKARPIIDLQVGDVFAPGTELECFLMHGQIVIKAA